MGKIWTEQKAVKKHNIFIYNEAILELGIDSIQAVQELKEKPGTIFRDMYHLTKNMVDLLNCMGIYLDDEEEKILSLEEETQKINGGRLSLNQSFLLYKRYQKNCSFSSIQNAIKVLANSQGEQAKKYLRDILGDFEGSPRAMTEMFVREKLEIE